ncbi:MAG: 30S ribosomal protein S7 [Anaerolineae bacterium]|nr:30S ribosomal protein S7 [Anaerolineae bacterium]NIN94350.1 30S ribosomal protein S7 [Anaerolineae bacterium]NIQ77413.1 30S ribosomal protein S7 [Anaerolineae bacterium]
MPRRYRPPRREVEPDPKYNSELVARFINRLMQRGKKSVAAGIMYDAFDIIEERTRRNPLEVFHQALDNATPALEVRSRRVGGATYQIPVEVRPERRTSLAIRWLIQSAQARKGRPMAERLADELMDASRNTGTTVKKKDDTHKMAEANRAFAHYRW